MQTEAPKDREVALITPEDIRKRLGYTQEDIARVKHTLAGYCSRSDGSAPSDNRHVPNRDFLLGYLIASFNRTLEAYSHATTILARIENESQESKGPNVLLEALELAAKKSIEEFRMRGGATCKPTSLDADPETKPHFVTGLSVVKESDGSDFKGVQALTSKPESENPSCE